MPRIMRLTLAAGVVAASLMAAAPAQAARPALDRNGNNLYCEYFVGSEQQLKTIRSVRIDDNYAFSAQPKKQCPGPFNGQGS